MNATEIKNAAADILSTMLSNVETLEKALAVAKTLHEPGYVFVWPTYWLAVRTAKDGMNACSVDKAFITHKADHRIFTNGHGEQAVLMPLVRALEGALTHGIAVHADFAERLAKQA